MLTFFLILLVYWLIGLATIFYISGKTSSEENPAWIIIYCLGPIFWPPILINYIRCKNKI